MDAELPPVRKPPSSNTGVRVAPGGWAPVPVPAMWYAAVDWLRLTLRHTDEGPVDDMVYWRAIRQVADAMDSSGVAPRPWARLGYYGEQIGKAAWGRGPQGLYLEVTGAWAQAAVELNLPYDNVPRLDVQLTLWYEGDMPHIARNAAAAAYANYVGRGRRAAKPRLVDGFGSGDTCYIGSRNSERFLRIYDKGREAQTEPDWANSWRFEAVYTNEAALAAWPETAETLSTPEYWAGLVLRECQASGVMLPRTLPAAARRPPAVECVGSDEERRLMWLRNHVRGTVDKLRAAGVPLEHIEAALGLEGAETSASARN